MICLGEIMAKTNQYMKAIEEYFTLLLSSAVNLKFDSDISDFIDIQKIAVIKLDHIGDVILSIPALANIRHRFPNAKITVVVNPSSRQIAELIPYVDDVICYNARFFDRNKSTKIFDMPKGIGFALDMKRRNFDLIVDFRGSFASVFYALISKSRYRIDRGSYLLKRKLNQSDDAEIKSSFAIRQMGDNLSPKHEAMIALDILLKAGIDVVTKETGLKDTGSSSFANDNLKIVIHPGGPMQQKRWSTDNYVNLINQILDMFDSQIYLIGGKDESELVKSIISDVSNERITDLSGKLSLAELVGVLKKADLFIGNDSGPMHVASACGTKVIGLYGPTDAERFGPYGKNCMALRMEKNCPPCSHGQCKYANYRCIDQISVEDAIKAINEMLDSHSKH